MTKAADLDALVRVQQTALTAAQTRVAVIQRQEADLRAQIADLRARKLEVHTRDDPATRAGADTRWQGWIASRLESLNNELAQVCAEKDRQIAVLRVAFGRDQAMRALANRAKAEARQINARRSL